MYITGVRVNGTCVSDGYTGPSCELYIYNASRAMSYIPNEGLTLQQAVVNFYSVLLSIRRRDCNFGGNGTIIVAQSMCF